MFESVLESSDAAARLRRVAFITFAAFAAILGYYTIVALLPSVPAALFYVVDAIALCGFLFGAIASLRIAIREPLDRRARFTLVAALALAAANGWVFASLTFPWL